MKALRIGVQILAVLMLLATWSFAQDESTNKNKFRQLYQEFATPTVYRTAGGAPGHMYYQQKADYNMKIRLDDEKQIVYGEETITYHNNSPDALDYLWIQLDQNVRAKDSDSRKIQPESISERMTFGDVKRMHNDFDGGFKLDYVKDGSGKDLDFVVNKTMMRINLPKALQPKGSTSLKIKWWYNINDRLAIGGRSGYEYFKEEDNYLYTIAQFFPRMAVYNETEGWQNKQFLGRGEFTLPFGDYSVDITVPSDHVVSSTGELVNASSVLSSEQQARMKKAKTSFDEPVFIVTQEEAEKSEKEKPTGSKTWSFKAKNVRDFAFASSRKFIWDAMGVKFGNRTVLAMSFYPKEGNPLWEQYSTKVVAHTLKIYSKYTVEYPYPVAQSIHSKWIGMEYPMICFNGGRPEPDGTYSKRTKYGMLGVIIHEVGHNFFPMIINSDERQWTWMDEGLNTFVQYLTEQEWERDYPSRRGPAYKIVDYMKGEKSNISPIMTNSESIWQFGNNAYGKPATALNILRETVMGRELFDYAFKTYCERWKFKHPNPEDFFRTMEDASGVDLDWFWRGWFYGTDHVDISIDDVKWFKVDTKNPETENPRLKAENSKESDFIGDSRNKVEIPQTYSEKDESLNDFYNKFDPFQVNILDKEEYQRYVEDLNQDEIGLLNPEDNYYEVSFSNVGGLVMPLILEFTYVDGSKEVERIPAEIWRRQHQKVSRVFITTKEIQSIQLDPFLETADVNEGNNFWPKRNVPTRFQLYRENKEKENPMQRDKRAKEKEKSSDLGQ